MFISQDWRDFEVLDTGDGMKLERWGSFILSRPDPQVIWPRAQEQLWRRADAHYSRSERGGGAWEFHTRLPERWELQYKDLRFYVKPTGFKHTGLFPEQAANWDWMRGKLRDKPGARVLNLFAYTGGASLACAAEGAKVTHVDASKGMAQWAKDNRALSRLPDTSLRYIVEDAMRFVSREIRRGSRYEGILMDPPSYGRGPSGEVWKLEDELYRLCQAASELLSENALFFLINSYTTGFQPAVLQNILGRCVQAKRGGRVDAQELVLPVSSGGVLPCGSSGRWESA